MTIKNKLTTSVSTTAYVAYGQSINNKWNAETKLEGLLEIAKQASAILADEIVATGGKQIDLIFEKGKEKPIRNAVVSALIEPMPKKKSDLIFLRDKKELHKPATKTEIAWCSPSYIALQFAQIEKSEQRTFIRKADVRNFLTSRINTAVDDLRAMVAYRLGEQKLSAKDAKEGIEPKKRSDKKAVKKAVKEEKSDPTPKSDREKIHAQINNAITIAQNTRDDSFNKVEVLVLLQKLTKLLK